MLKIYIIHLILLSWVTISTLGDITCQDPQFSCDDESTCCQMKDGTWGCCPMPNAVCCSDKEHCCPEDTICDIKHLACNKTDGTQLKITSKRILKKTLPKQTGAPCGDGSTECPTGTTCCKLASGDWGCCLFPNAVCCSDKLHCCPEQTTCDLSSGSCVKEAGRIPWARKLPSKQRSFGMNDIPCDGKTACPDGTTCCKADQGKWACCPMPNAVCCNDHEHCCPSGTTCNVEEGKCDQGPAFRIPLNKISKKKNDITCDEQTKCPSSMTCCKMVSGQWGCCPMEKAVCCSDGVHCCPENTVCDEEQQRCSPTNRLRVPVPWVEKIPAWPRKFRLGEVQCDDQYNCPDDTTCCKIESGKWGCCMMPNAVCCSDNVHCCPENTVCDVGAGTCTPSGQIRRKLISPAPSKSWLDFFNAVENRISKIDSFSLIDPPEPLKEPKMTTCPDGASKCLQEMSCCQTNEGYGCCPFTNGQCCSNKEYCCPGGTTCNGTICQTNYGGKSMQFDASKLITIKSGSNSQCKNGIDSCPENSKCCKTLFGGRYGCCPDPQGICCADGLSCCPKGYVCKKNGQCGAVRFD